MSRNIIHFLRHSSEVRYDSEGFVRLSELMNITNCLVSSLLTPAKLLVAVFSNPKARFQFSYPVYRVTGTNRKQFVMPDIGLRAVQGRYTCRDTCIGYLLAAQESLHAYQADLPCLCAHGTDPASCKGIKDHLISRQAAKLATGRLSTLLWVSLVTTAALSLASEQTLASTYYSTSSSG